MKLSQFRWAKFVDKKEWTIIHYINDHTIYALQQPYVFNSDHIEEFGEFIPKRKGK